MEHYVRCICFCFLVLACLLYTYLEVEDIGKANKLMILNNTTFHNFSRIHQPHLKYDKRIFFILWFEQPQWVNDINPFPIKNCKYNNCNLLFDKKKSSKCDLVIFDHDLFPHKMPRKFNHQKWIFFSFEPEPYTSPSYKRRTWKNAFDWTMSFRKDSEGYAPYGKIIQKEETSSKNYSEIFKKKKKNIVWFVSHCNTASKREDYVEQMQKYIDIDIFGKCGNDSCREPGCKPRLISEYKFYLAFENSICFDYSTEKIFSIYNDNTWNNIIPVVRGDPNIKSVLPNNTYISTTDFKSPKELSSYIKSIAENETLFSEMIMHKDRFTTTGSLYSDSMCSLCHRLNTGYKRTMKLRMDQWYLNQCKTPTDI